MKGQIAAEDKNENGTQAVEEVRTGFYTESDRFKIGRSLLFMLHLTSAGIHPACRRQDTCRCLRLTTVRSHNNMVSV
jgi:hypothetical protein